MAGLLPPVVATLLADTKEYTAKMDEATGKMEEFGAASDTTGSKLGSFASKASTAIIGVGVAFAAYATDEALKFQEALDKVQNTTNVTTKELSHISSESLKISDATGQTAVNIVGAYGAVEAAGYKRAAADKAVTAAAKLTLIAGGDVVANTQSLIAAQNLGITKGMSAAKVADLLTVALKGNEGGLSGVVSLLSGKVGAAFAGYHQSAGEAVAVANEFSMAGITQTRQIATFVQKLGALQGPMETTSISNGKLTTTSASYVNSLKDVGLNVDKTKQAFTGPDGLVNGLKYLKTAADGSLPQLQRYLAAIFGATGVGSGMALINNLTTLTKTIHAANNASGTGLNKAASVAAGQLDNQMKIIEERLKNTAIQFGLKLLPYIEKAAKLIEDAMNFLDKHPAVMKALATTFGVLFAAAVADKLATGLKSIWGVINSRAQTGLLEDIAANTSKIAAEGGATALEGAGGDAALGAGALGGVGATGATAPQAVGLFLAGIASFEITSKLLQTNLGNKIGTWVTTFGGGANIFHDAATLFASTVSQSSFAAKGTKDYLSSIGGKSLYNQELAAIKAGNQDLANKLSSELTALEAKTAPKPGTKKTGKSTLSANVSVHLH